MKIGELCIASFENEWHTQAMTWADAARLIEKLPDAVAGATFGQRAWKVKGRLFVWERPLRKTELAVLGDAAPKGDVLGLRVPLEVKDLLVAKGLPYFTTPHFNGYPAVLIALAKLKAPALKRLLGDALQSALAAAPAKPRSRRTG